MTYIVKDNFIKYLESPVSFVVSGMGGNSDDKE